MKANELLEKIKQAITEGLKLRIAPETIGDRDLLVGGPLGLDSVDMLTLVMVLEDRFGIKILDEELKELGTVADIARFLEQRISPDR